MPESTRLVKPAFLWFSILALLTAGPLLGSGYLLLLDWPSGPRFPHTGFFPDPARGVIGNAAPLNALHALVRDLYVYLPDKVFLIAPILLGGLGVSRFARNRLNTGIWAGILGGTLFVINPWVIDRYLSGHLHLLLGYSLLPWAVAPLFDAIESPSLKKAAAAGGWLFALSVIDLHVAGMYTLLLVACYLAVPSSRRLLLAAASLVLAALLCAYWLAPALLTPPDILVGEADLAVYASRPRGLQVLPTLVAMYGFWRNEFLGPAARIPALFLLLVPILSLVALGVRRSLSFERRRRFVIVLLVSSLVALLLAAGDSFPPTAEIFRWVFDHVPPFRIYREPQKFLALLILAYAVFLAVGVGVVLERANPWWRGVAIGMSAMIVLIYGYTAFWGFWRQVELSQYPTDWYVAERYLQQSGDDERLLILPWHLYAVWSFSDGRIVANPARSFFSHDPLVNPEAGFESVPTQSPDPAARAVAHLLEDRRTLSSLGRELAQLGVGYVALLREVDFWSYRFLRRDPNLTILYEGRKILLVRNEVTRSVAPVALWGENVG